MERPIMTSEFFLSLQCKKATLDDLQTGQDLLDTLQAHAEECVGMAANMIGVAKRIIVFFDDGKARLMFNPEIIESKGRFMTREGCLSLSGTREATRYRSITVRFDNEQFEQHTEHFEGWTAQIIQHEVDHCNGILI